MPEFVKAAKTTDLKSGEARVIECSGRTLALCNVEGRYYALDNTCLHRGGPIGEGFIDGETVTCPWHGWQYDVRSGVNTMDESEVVARYEVKIEGGEVLVAV